MARRRKSRAAEGLVYLAILSLVFSWVISAVKTLLPLMGIVILAIGLVYLAFKLYVYAFFHGRNFQEMKACIQTHIRECNDLNEHIEDLKSFRIEIDHSRYGISDYHDASKWNYQRSELSKIENDPFVYSCSRAICDNSRKNPMQYVCKYFGIKADEKTLESFEQTLNDFSAVEDGKKALMQQRAEILAGVSDRVPGLIHKYCEDRLEKELGFETVDLTDAWYPRFVFQYVSPGGNASTENVILMDVPNLEAMVNYLNDRIKWSKSVAHQRSLMTRALRKSILVRDEYTCKQCGVSLKDEPHLLLEIDHIIPVSKGGLTTVDNLQTLCWRCNRTKGAN